MYDNSNLIQLLKSSVSAYHTVQAAADRLRDAGFWEWKWQQPLDLKTGDACFLNHNDSALFAVTITEKSSDDGAPAVRIAAAHTDFPGISLKSNPDITKNGYQQLNVEVYGGPILNTWLDRPLSAAGMVILRGTTPFSPITKLVDLKQPFATIPNLAVHMNRDVNKGVELNRQTQLLPIAGLSGENLDKDVFLQYLAEQISVEREEILSFDLQLYPIQEPTLVGMKAEMLQAPHLDNTTSVQALLDGIISSVSCVHAADGDVCAAPQTITKNIASSLHPIEDVQINVIALFDHEEVGSRTHQGAGSMVLHTFLECVQRALTKKEAADLSPLLTQAMLLSVDVAHASHPNYMEKMDLTNQPVLGKGFCIKEACSQSYATDARVIGMVTELCRINEIPFQIFTNRSDQPGGSTLGSIASSFLPIPTIDIGIPLLAMHSANELMGLCDMESLSKFVTLFFSSKQ